MKSLGVFCGSHAGRGEAYRTAAAQFAREVARRGITIVYGGGHVGLMGVVADAAMAAGGRVVGVLPRFLHEREVGHAGLSELHLVDSMHERKARMADASSGFIALPGGFGTMDELFEILTWAQLGLHAKPCGLLDVDGYYASLITFLDHAAAEGLLRPEHRAMLLVDRDPAALLDRMERYVGPVVTPLIRAGQT